MNRQDGHASPEAMQNKTPYVHRLHNNRWVSADQRAVDADTQDLSVVANEAFRNSL